MKNKLAEKDQVRIIVRNVSPNMVERLQMMNPKTFVDLHDDRLQAEEMENEKKKTGRSTKTRNYPTGGTQQANTSRAMEVRAIQPPRTLSNFNQPLSKFLDRLIQKGLLRPLTVSRPPNPNLSGFDPNSYCKFHQITSHSTDSCMRLKHEIKDLIDSEKITDTQKLNPNPSTKNNPFRNYPNVPPPAAIVINLGISKEESPDASKNEEESKKPATLSYLPREIEKEVIEEVIEEI